MPKMVSREIVIARIEFLLTGVLRAIECSPIARDTVARQARRKPPVLFWILSLKLPRENSDQDVVMPQPGHGRSKRTRIEHGGRPNC